MPPIYSIGPFLWITIVLVAVAFFVVLPRLEGRPRLYTLWLLCALFICNAALASWSEHRSIRSGDIVVVNKAEYTVVGEPYAGKIEARTKDGELRVWVPSDVESYRLVGR